MHWAAFILIQILKIPPSDFTLAIIATKDSFVQLG
jgi:hypothetical protein